MSKNTEQISENQLQRFTTLINPLVLSHIKLIGYFTNRKLYEVINDSLELMSKIHLLNKWIKKVRVKHSTYYPIKKGKFLLPFF